MTALYRNRQASFTSLRNGLGLTDGNLASHAGKLEAAGYVKSGRVLVALHFEVQYRITEKGAAAFRAYVERLRLLVQEIGPLDTGPGTAADPQGTSASS